jgi:hypothetical protein
LWKAVAIEKPDKEVRTSKDKLDSFQNYLGKARVEKNEAKRTHGSSAAMAGSERCPRNDGLAIEQCHNSPSFAAVKEWQGRAGNLNMVCGTASNGSIKERYGLW